MAHYEPPHQDLHCLQIQVFSSLVVKDYKATGVDPDAMAHYKQPHLNLHCLQIKAFLFLVLRVLRQVLLDVTKTEGFFLFSVIFL